MKNWINYTASMIVMEVFEQYSRQRMLVQMIQTAKECTTQIAILKILFISVQVPLHMKLVHLAASFRKTKMVNISNHFILQKLSIEHFKLKSTYHSLMLISISAFGSSATTLEPTMQWTSTIAPSSPATTLTTTMVPSIPTLAEGK